MSDDPMDKAKTMMTDASSSAQEMGRTMMEKSMAGMTEFSRMFADMKMPMMGGGMEAFVAAQRKNMEVLSAANRVALEGAQAGRDPAHGDHAADHVRDVGEPA